MGNDPRRLLAPRARGVAGLPARASGTEALAAMTTPDLVAQLPDSDIVEFGCYGIVVPTGLDTPNAGWYGLQSATVGDDGDFADDVIWTSWMMDNTSSDGTGLGVAELATAFGVSPIAWGSANGFNAFVVIGVNLPCQYGVWSDGPLLPTLGVTGEGLQVARGANRRRVAIPYQPGSFATSNTNAARSENRAPLAHRVARGERLDVALVVRSSVTNARGTAGYIRAHVFGHVTVSKMTSGVGLGR